MLCDAGYDARPQGTIRRLVAHARREVTNYKLETGETAQRVETFPGEVDLTSVEVIIPADAGLRPSIPGPQRHHRNPAVHRRKATP
jgi:hypothetical protein